MGFTFRLYQHLALPTAAFFSFVTNQKLVCVCQFPCIDLPSLIVERIYTEGYCSLMRQNLEREQSVVEIDIGEKKRG